MAADVYCLGLVLHELFVGQMYDGSVVSGALAPAVRPVVKRALLFKPDKRPTAQQVASYDGFRVVGQRRLLALLARVPRLLFWRGALHACR